nr:SMP-30/gluconolactonase/LRE family protein [Pyrinomonadaceae bacterium]
VWLVAPDGQKREVDAGINRPNGVLLSPDQSLLYVADTAGQLVYSFQIRPDGSLAHKQPYFHLHIPEGTTESGADGMTVDTDGRLYVATRMGLQVCDQAGRVNAIIAKPQRATLSNAVFGGPGLDQLYVTCGDKVYRRKVKTKGVLSFQSPIKPAPPRL